MRLTRMLSHSSPIVGNLGYTLTEEKIFILVGMFFFTAIFGFLPRTLISDPHSRDPRWRRAISALSCFSGGVFVGACLLDLFPDVRESVDAVLDQIEAIYHTKVDYPVAEFVMVLGFLVVLLIEQLVLEYGGGGETGARQTSSETTPLLTDGGNQEDRGHGTFAQQQQLPHDADIENEVSGSGDNQGPSVGFSDPPSDSHAGHSHVALDHSSLRSYLLLMALTFHSVFEGLAIGLAQVTGQLLSIFTAVIIHKSIMAFSLGLTMAQSPRISLRNFALSILIFSLASPLGMAIGIGLSDLEPSLYRDAFNGTLQGMAGGTFLYITFFEVLPAELSADAKSDYSRMIKFLFVVLGYSCICGVLFFTH